MPKIKIHIKKRVGLIRSREIEGTYEVEADSFDELKKLLEVLEKHEFKVD